MLKIDCTARRVWVNEEEKPFTTKEFDLLTFLATNPNRVFSKEDLFRNIWDMESVGDIATVTVHIKFTNNKYPEDNVEKDFSAYAEYDSTNTLDAVESTLCEQIIEQLAEDIFNACVAQW